jgi:predicted nucleic acid-binding Zn ribbon protein
MIYTEAPVIRCPECTGRFQHNAHWELTLDHELECEHCGAKLRLVAEDAVRHWSWHSTSELPTEESKG